MSRFSQYDEDEERLPDGMRRVGYDADTERYQYQDENGDFWEGPPGSRYGALRPVGHHGRLDEENYAQTDPFIDPPSEAQLQHYQKESWRMMMPFFLLVAVFLLVVFWWVGRPAATEVAAPTPVVCGEQSTPHIIKEGDTCWSIAEKYGANVEVLKRENSRLDCDRLQIGAGICVPKSS
jgi:hypothetical protein